jgi:hypothetical protein
MFIRKTIFSTNLILCIIIYVIKLKQILKNENIENMDKHTEKLYFIKKISDMGVDLFSKNFLKFFFHILPYSGFIYQKIMKRKEMKKNE